MANNIINIKNSFIQFCDAEQPESCGFYTQVSLPIHDENDLQFMIRIDDTDTDYLDGLGFYLIRGGHDEGDHFALTDVIHQFSFQYAQIDTGDYILAIIDESCGSGDLGETTYPAEIGECIKLVIARRGDREILCICHSKFHYIPESKLCFTQVIRYGCTDNAFGFYYEEINTQIAGTFYNQIRLPIDLHSPKPISTKKGFVTSTGRFITLSARKYKEWEVMTGPLTDALHQALDAAIDHDKLFLSQTIISGCDYSLKEFHHQEDDDYEIEWEEGPGQHIGVAPAKFKLVQTPYYSTNNNC